MISNSFKNENVSQITLPRLPIPYDTFQTLVDFKFEIFTRGTCVGNAKLKGFASFMQNMFYMWMPSSLKHSNGTDTGEHAISPLLFTSELRYYAKMQRSGFHWTNVFYPISSFSEHVQKLMNVTKLYPLWIELFEGSHLSEVDILKDCNKSAILLPDIEAHDLYYELKGRGLNAFLGEDVNLNFTHGMLFVRWVNPFILQRMKGLDNSGVLKWWTNMLENFMMKVKGGRFLDVRQPFKPSNMKGNICIVFGIFGFGIFCTGIVFLLENYKQVWWFTQPFGRICMSGIRELSNECKKRCKML